MDEGVRSAPTPRGPSPNSPSPNSPSPNSPIWADDAPESLGRPAAGALPARIPFLVIGAGISGAWCALELARGGADVVVLEQGVPGDGATGRNAGFLLAESDCFGLAAEHHGDVVAHRLRELGLRTRALIRGLAGARSRSIGLRWTGSVRLAEDAGETHAFERSTAAALDGVCPTAVDRVAERGVTQRYRAALRDDGDGVVHPLRLLDMVLREARAAGADIRPRTPVTEVRPARGGVLVRTAQGDVRAGRVVLATSAAGRLLVGATRPIRPVRAQALAARVVPSPAWRRPVYATRGGDYWRPLSRGRVLLGGLRRLRRRHENTGRVAPTPELQESLDALLRDLVGPCARIEVTHRWAGTMAFTPDGLPWTGDLRRTRHVSVLAGLNGHGMGWAPALAEGLTAHLLGNGPPPPSAFRPR